MKQTHAVATLSPVAIAWILGKRPMVTRLVRMGSGGPRIHLICA